MRPRTVMVGIAAATLLAACGTTTQYHGSSPRLVVTDPTQLIASSADATTQATSARMSGHMTMSGARLPRDVTFSLDGVSSLDGHAADLKMDMSSLLGFVPGRASGASSLIVEVRLIDGVEYMNFGDLMRGMANGRPAPPSLRSIKWLKLDLSKATGGGASGLGSSPASFTKYLEYLRGVGAVTTVGPEAVRGVATTHYRAVIDRDKLRSRLGTVDSPALRKLAEQGLDLFDGGLTFDVWIGDTDRLVHRMSFSVAMAFGGESMHLDMTLDLYDFGVAVDVQPPPASEVRDFSALTSLARAGSGV